MSLNVIELTVLLYLAAAATLGALLTYIGSRAITSRRIDSATALRDLLANDYYEAVSVCVPAFNAEDTIVETVRSLLNLQHPMFDVIVVNDGSSDETLDRLVARFGLVEVPIAHDGGFETQMLNVMYRSLDHANLTVIDKDHGGRADALNAALNLARRTLVCVVDADVVLEPLALAGPSRRFVEDESVVAVAAIVPPDHAPGGGGRAGSWPERLQEVDHARRAAIAAGWSAIGAGMDGDGFVMYRRRSLLEICGWTTDTDAETLLALHRIGRARGEPYRVLFTADRVGRMRAEAGIGGVLRWRGRRWRALIRALWGERGMVLRPAYGRVGMLAIGARIVFEAGGPFVEAAAYIYLAVTAAMGLTNPAFAIGLIVFGPLIKAMATQVATAGDTPPPFEPSRRTALFWTAVAEQLGIAQLGIVASIGALIRPSHAEPQDPYADVVDADAPPQTRVEALRTPPRS